MNIFGNWVFQIQVRYELYIMWIKEWLPASFVENFLHIIWTRYYYGVTTHCPRTSIQLWGHSDYLPSTKVFQFIRLFYIVIPFWFLYHKTSCPWLGPPLSLLSCLGEPMLSFLIIFPLFVSVKRQVGVRYMASLMVSQWVGMVLKLLMKGDRPYWWSHTTQTFTYETEIVQTAETCQTGPGCPSSHSMSWAVTSYVRFSVIFGIIMTAIISQK